MGPDRFELYTPIHKALRRLMSGLVTRAGSADWNDSDEVAAIQADWDTAMMLVASHHHHEDELIHPLLAQAAPGAHHEIEREHEEQSAARKDLTDFLANLASSDRPGPQKQRLGAEFTTALYVYYASLLTHMQREEVDAQCLLDGHYTVGELAAVQKQIVGSLPPEEMMVTLDAMFPALSVYEQAGILGGIKADAPPHVFEAISARVRNAICDDAWTKLAARIGL